MNTQAERLTSRRDARVFGFTYLRKFAAWMELKREARRARRHEMALRDTLKAMSPDLLDDIGVALDADGDPVLEFANQNPFVVATKILGHSPRWHDPH
jgi:uncharacterized protein YjiS (DUF1127 family)